MSPLMRSHLRTLIVLALALALVVLFLYNVDLRGVVRQIVHARPDWLVFSLATMLINLAIRGEYWSGPTPDTTFLDNVVLFSRAARSPMPPPNDCACPAP